MKFTIVTPVLNGEKYIRKTVESVLSQTHQNFEYIIVDGASKDKTLNILLDYKDHPSLKIISEEDGGQSEAINKGFSIATGDILYWLNYDDYLIDKNILSKINYLFESFDYNFIYGDDFLVNEDCKIIKKRSFRGMSLNKLVYLKSLSQPACFFRRDFFDRYKLREDLNFSMDLNLWLNFMADSNVRIFYFDSVIACNRIHKNRKMVKFELEAKKEAESLRLSFCNDNFFVYRLKKILYRFLSFIS